MRATSAQTWVDITYLKWRDQPHYAYRMRVLGEDVHGVWGSCDAGEAVYKAGTLAFIREHTMLSLVPRDRCWSALWYPPAEADYEVYVDINSPPEWSGDAVTMVDLDFDVVRRRDGAVLRLDEDEFDEHRVAFEYPGDLVDMARAAVDATERLVAGPAEPFATAWRGWYSACFPEQPGSFSP